MHEFDLLKNRRRKFHCVLNPLFEVFAIRKRDVLGKCLVITAVNLPSGDKTFLDLLDLIILMIEKAIDC